MERHILTQLPSLIFYCDLQLQPTTSNMGCVDITGPSKDLTLTLVLNCAASLFLWLLSAPPRLPGA